MRWVSCSDGFAMARKPEGRGTDAAAFRCRWGFVAQITLRTAFPFPRANLSRAPRERRSKGGEAVHSWTVRFSETSSTISISEREDGSDDRRSAKDPSQPAQS